MAIEIKEIDTVADDLVSIVEEVEGLHPTEASYLKDKFVARLHEIVLVFSGPTHSVTDISGR